jgi:hypothetical protein
MEQTVNILRGLLALVDRGTFNVNTEGATKIAGLRQAAEAELNRLEAELATPSDIEDSEDDSIIQE